MTSQKILHKEMGTTSHAYPKLQWRLSCINLFHRLIHHAPMLLVHPCPLQLSRRPHVFTSREPLNNPHNAILWPENRRKLQPPNTMQDEVKIRLEFDHLKSKISTTNSLLQCRQISPQQKIVR